MPVLQFSFSIEALLFDKFYHIAPHAALKGFNEAGHPELLF